ncbi:MAG TPA: NAD-dependent deacylase, partial [Aggregatilineales bacterium]|nr:NAD-dependent deacylase [Aggregatilineales bacterium]
ASHWRCASVPGRSDACPPMTPQTPLDQAAALLRSARYAVALTGAGISTPSGIPDFRSPNSGLWSQHDPFEVASMVGFRYNPRSFFDWIRPLARRMLEAQPNPAHIALARLEALGIIRSVITQNIDMLHTRAGSRQVYEVHGHMRLATCVECFAEVETESFIWRFIEEGDIPRCAGCGGVLKPNVILFGEALPIRVLRAAQREARICDVMLIAGSSLEVAPVSDLPIIAKAHGAQLIVVNYDETFVDDDAAVVIHDDVATVLPRLVEALEGDG